MKISEDVKLDFDDVLIKPKRSDIKSRGDVNIVRKFKPKFAKCELSCFPLVVANMDTTGTFEMAKTMHNYNAMCALNKHYTIDQLKYFCNNFPDVSLSSTFFTIGQSKEELDKLAELFKDNFYHSRKICIDVANGYTEKFVDAVKRARDRFPNNLIMVGNVCTAEMTEQLILSGADIVKIGIGPGSVCTTRIKTGIGYPQLSAILECKDAAHGLGGLICGDGGIKNAGDAAKAFGAGSDLIMIGGMFAGCHECDGEWEYEYPERKKSLKFYGMSSKDAQEKYNGGIAEHRAAEGKCVTIPYKGFAKDVLLDIQGGVRSACAYTGAKTLKDFDKCCSFVRVNRTHNTIYGS
jgi:GMP reductase